MNETRISYTKSLRSKLLLLVSVPIIVLGTVFIFISLATNRIILEKVNEIYGSSSIDISWIKTLWIFVFAGAVAIISPINARAIRAFIHPLRKLTSDARQLASGDINVSVEQNRQDEFGIAWAIRANGPSIGQKAY